eukprot:2200725-Pleurochrysis_carterae.AAC.2
MREREREADAKTRKDTRARAMRGKVKQRYARTSESNRTPLSGWHSWSMGHLNHTKDEVPNSHTICCRARHDGDWHRILPRQDNLRTAPTDDSV